MRNKSIQMSLFDTYKSIESCLEDDKPAVFKLIDKHIDWDTLISTRFRLAFYKRLGRNRRYELESFLRAMFLQRIFHYTEDSQLLNTLRFSKEMRDFCGFDKVPDASKITRFKQEFCEYIAELFERLVELTEPICRNMDKTLADCLVYDTTGIESYVAENNPKFWAGKISAAKVMVKSQSGRNNIYGLATSFLPECAASNPAVKNQFINGHFCYAQKAVIVANGLGIVRHLQLLDDKFKTSHPEMPVDKRTDDPTADKEIGDSTTLKPLLSDFRRLHPSFHYSTFTADAAFDSFDNYAFLLKEYGFSRAVIPLNLRGRKATMPVNFDVNGTPLCPSDGTPMVFDGKTGGKHRSTRFKYICPKTKRVKTPTGMTGVCSCEHPCTPSRYGRCVYTYPDKDLRLYPGISRNTQEWDAIYSSRICVERSIHSLKSTLGLDGRKTSHVLTTKADLYLAGIVQLLCVVLADAMHDHRLALRPRKLIAA